MTVIVFGALVWQVVDFLREVAHLKANRSAVVTQLTAWIGGILLVLLGAHAVATKTLVLPGSVQPLGALDWPSIILVGMLISSLASTGVDVKQALDGADTAAKPPMLTTAPWRPANVPSAGNPPIPARKR